MNRMRHYSSKSESNTSKVKAKTKTVRSYKSFMTMTNLTAATLLVFIASIHMGSPNYPSAFVDARRSGGGSSGGGRVPGGAAGRRSAGSSGSRSGGSGGGGRNKSSSRSSSSSSQVASKRRRSYYDDDEEDTSGNGSGNGAAAAEEEEPEMNFGFLDDDMEEDDDAHGHGHDNYDNFEEDVDEPVVTVTSRNRARGGRDGRSASRGSGGSGRGSRGAGRTPPPRRSRYEQDYDDEYDEEEDDDYYRRSSSSSSGRRGPPPPQQKQQPKRSSKTNQPNRRSSSGNVVPYRGGRNQRSAHAQPTSAFTRGLAALRDSIPDPNAFKDTAINSLSAARETTTKLTSNIYREVKGLTSSELEQVMLKATAPNDVPVKGKHVERLVGVTYQISGRYDIYDAVLRKLWSKMVEKDWRTTVKALYILHRFSADGAPDHQAALKARLRELRRTRDPKRGKEKYFNSKQLLSGDTSPENIPFRAFLSRYAHYVLLRAQCFGGMFTEIANDPNKAKPLPSSNKPQNTRSSRQQQQQQQQQQRNTRATTKKCITSTCLKNEHLEAAQMLLKAGLACELKSNGEEECENTAIALERVVSDLIGLTTAVATALNNALKGDYDADVDMDWELVTKWCEFYSTQLLVKTKSMMKRTTPILDAYGLFLPSRMGASVSQDVLQKGLKGRSPPSSSSGDGDGEDEAPTADGREDDEALDREEEGDVMEGKGEVDEDNMDQERGEAEADVVDEDEMIDEGDGYDEYDEYEYEEYDEYE